MVQRMMAVVRGVEVWMVTDGWAPFIVWPLVSVLWVVCSIWFVRSL